MHRGHQCGHHLRMNLHLRVHQALQGHRCTGLINPNTVMSLTGVCMGVCGCDQKVPPKGATVFKCHPKWHIKCLIICLPVLFSRDQEETIDSNGRVIIPNPDPLWILSGRISGSGYHGVSYDKHAVNKGSRKCWRLVISKKKICMAATARECCNRHPRFLKLRKTVRAKKKSEQARRSKLHKNEADQIMADQSDASIQSGEEQRRLKKRHAQRQRFVMEWQKCAFIYKCA